MKKKGIAVVGRMAEGIQLLDGQTVKTKILLEELRRCYPDHDFVCVDTYQYRKRAIPILLRTARAFLQCEHIFVLLSRNGRKFFFPLLTGLNKIFRRKLYHDVVGGALPGEASKSPALQKQLKQFEINWVEFAQMKDSLEQLGIHNVEVLPNFKRLNLLKEEDLKDYTQEPFIFTMFSRVVKEKGMEEAARSIDAANRHFGSKRTELHIYGPVDPQYEEEFQRLLQTYEHCVIYKGCIPQNESVEALKSSFMLLFPSYYAGEGMPGTIIDAFSAGLPVIATDWHFNGELVKNGITGYCYDWQKPELLTAHIIYAVTHPTEVNAMRSACIKEAGRYTPEAAMRQICQKLN